MLFQWVVCKLSLYFGLKLSCALIDSHALSSTLNVFIFFRRVDGSFCYPNLKFHFNWLSILMFSGGPLASCCGKHLPLGVPPTLASPQSSFLTTWVKVNVWTSQPSALWRCTLSWGTAGFTTQIRGHNSWDWTNTWERSWREIWQRYGMPGLVKKQQFLPSHALLELRLVMPS